MIIRRSKIYGIQQKLFKREFYTSLPNETKINVPQPSKGHIEPSVQFNPVSQLCLTLCDPMDCSTPGFPSITNSWSLLKLMSITSVMPSNDLILCLPILLLPSIFPSIRVFSNELILHIRWPKYWSFSFGFNPSNEYSGLIFFRIDWLDLLAVQGILKSLLQHIKPTAFAIFLRWGTRQRSPLSPLLFNMVLAVQVILIWQEKEIKGI